jgi:hypothetical protein
MGKGSKLRAVVMNLQHINLWIFTVATTDYSIIQTPPFSYIISILKGCNKIFARAIPLNADRGNGSKNGQSLCPEMPIMKLLDPSVPVIGSGA